MGERLRKVVLGIVIGALAGAVVLGICGRVAMRGVALMGGLKGGFSWGGSFEVVLLGLIIGAISGGIYGLLRNFFFANKWLAGSLFGLLVFVAILLLPIDGKGAARGFPDLKLAVYLIFGGLHLVFGIISVFSFDRFSKAV